MPFRIVARHWGCSLASRRRGSTNRVVKVLRTRHYSRSRHLIYFTFALEGGSVKSISIKFWRSKPDRLESYGPVVIKRLDKLAGGAGNWNMSKAHGFAPIPGTKITIVRHENGPEFHNLFVTQFPNWVSAIAAVASAWFAHKALKGSNEQRTVKLRIGKHSYDGPIKNARDLNRVVGILKNLK
jgi:hypothetical protein